MKRSGWTPGRGVQGGSWRVGVGLFGLWGLALALVAGCDPDLVVGQDYCDEAAIAAAQRSFQCTGDGSASNAAHDDLASLKCTVPDPPEESSDPLVSTPPYAEQLGCTRELLAVDCAIVAQAPREPRRWLPKACASTFEVPSGAVGAGGAAGAGGGAS